MIQLAYVAAMLMMEINDGDSSKDDLMSDEKHKGIDRDGSNDDSMSVEEHKGTDGDGSKDDLVTASRLDEMIGLQERKVDKALWEALTKEVGKNKTPRCLGCINHKKGKCSGPPACLACIKRGVFCEWALMKDRAQVNTVATNPEGDSIMLTRHLYHIDR